MSDTSTEQQTASYSDWPTKGDTRDQPWEHRDSGVTPRAGLPVLSSGSAEPGGHEIFAALARLGYDTPISRGENPVGVVGPEELSAVREFRRDYGVQEDPESVVGDVDTVVGPWTAEAILRASADQAPAGDAGAPAAAQSDVDALRAQVDQLAAQVGDTPPPSAPDTSAVDELTKKVDELTDRVDQLENPKTSDAPPPVSAPADPAPADTGGQTKG